MLNILGDSRRPAKRFRVIFFVCSLEIRDEIISEKRKRKKKEKRNRKKEREGAFFRNLFEPSINF